MLILALAGGRAFALESPDQAHGLVVVLWHRDFMSFHHARDAGVSTVPVTAEKCAVRVGIERGYRAGLGARLASGLTA